VGHFGGGKGETEKPPNKTHFRQEEKNRGKTLGERHSNCLLKIESQDTGMQKAPKGCLYLRPTRMGKGWVMGIRNGGPGELAERGEAQWDEEN